MWPSETLQSSLSCLSIILSSIISKPEHVLNVHRSICFVSFLFTTPFTAIASLFLPTDNLCPFMNIVFVKDVLMSLGGSCSSCWFIRAACLFVCVLVNKRLKEVSGLACWSWKHTGKMQFYFIPYILQGFYTTSDIKSVYVSNNGA